MTVDVRPQVLVRRARKDVAAYMFDPRRDLEWTGGITVSHVVTQGPVGEGTTVERSARFLGRRFTYRYVVTSIDPDRSMEMRVDRPFPMTIRYELDDADGGTTAAIHATGSPGRFFGWLTPLMRRQVRASIAGDLARLRDRLE
ncbi:MAG TPA: SRPBCC family protein [Streptosporangiaceae bacterium]|nr:SRPBCC family protein [Streptosporangiaceae bacterium]